ncbi:MAG TPA: hypothetical protein DIW30_00630 [Bacteroidales bacterium]|nr:hypothetical protein [Bacteroidales bacterium]
MKKTIFSFFAGVFLFVPAIAQVQVDTQAGFADYDRCSVSFINILYGDKYDEIVDIAVDNFDAGKKFDWNAINCGYPSQVFVQADYAVHISYSGKKEEYKFHNEELRTYGFGHSYGLGLSAGIKWTF